LLPKYAQRRVWGICKLIEETQDIMEYVPLSKTIIKDCTLMELQKGERRLQNFLAKQPFLSRDLLSCYNVLRFRDLGLIDVGNFRSLLVGLTVLDKIKGIKFKIKIGKQLSKRELDPHSSQWESAKVCCGQESTDRRYHVEIARKVVQRYNDGERETLFNTKDEVYERLLEYVIDGKPWSISNPEIDVFFAIFHPERLDDIIKNNPTWKHHESDRSKSILEGLYELLSSRPISSDDHRIVIGIALLAYLFGENLDRTLFVNYDCVSKSFPLFFDMLENLSLQQFKA